MKTTGDVIFLLLAALLMVPVMLAACVRNPPLVTLAFIAVLSLFSSSTWGQLQEENTIYSRGTGMFYFSLLNLMLWIASAAAWLRVLSHAPRRSLLHSVTPPSPFPVAIAITGFVLLSHVALGLMAGKDLLLILGYSGLINVLNLLWFAWLITQTLAEPAAQQRLLQLLLTLAGVRAVFGLVRYQWLGGDSANPYRNFEGLDIQLVYFDICDNFIAALAAFILAWLLLMPRVKLSFPKRVLLLLWLAWERRQPEPLVPHALFQNRNYLLMNWVGASMSFGMLGLFFPITIYLQSALRLTALQAGMTMLPMSLFSMLDRKSTRLNSSHVALSRMPSSA